MNYRHIILASKLFAYLMVSAVLLYLVNNYLVYWGDLPGTYRLLGHYGLGGAEAVALTSAQLTQAWSQVAAYLVVFAVVIFYALRRASSDLYQQSEFFSRFAAYLVRAAFWAVMLIGVADMLISFLRVEQLLQVFIGDDLITKLGRPSYRGAYVHFPLLALSFVAAFFFRQLSFSWLALMVVLAEFAIVITRFVFSYEQAFMGDLVRFWYAALFLFASAYTLLHEGHVRVDVLYAGFSRSKKAWSNIIGCIALGIPLCWVILMQGMGGKGNSINSPLLSFEISQSGYGMYVKYLMAGFMVVFAVTMIVQFVSYFLHNVAELTDPRPQQDDDEGHSAVVQEL